MTPCPVEVTEGGLHRTSLNPPDTSLCRAGELKRMSCSFIVLLGLSESSICSQCRVLFSEHTEPWAVFQSAFLLLKYCDQKQFKEEGFLLLLGFLFRLCVFVCLL